MNSDTSRSKKVNFDTNDYVHVLSDSPKRLIPRTPSGVRPIRGTKSIMKKSPRHIRHDSTDHYRLRIPLDRVVDSSSSNSDSFLPMVSPRIRTLSMSNSDERSPRLPGAIKVSSGNEADVTPTNFDYRSNENWKYATIDQASSGDAAMNMHMLKLPGGKIFDTVRSPTERSIDKSASARNLLSGMERSVSSNNVTGSSGGRSTTSMRSYSPEPSDSHFHYDARVEHIISKYKFSGERSGVKHLSSRPMHGGVKLVEKTAGVSLTQNETPEMTKIHRKYLPNNGMTPSRSEANLDIGFKFTPRNGGRHSPDAYGKMESAARVQSTVDSIIRNKKSNFNMGAFRMSLDTGRQN